MKNIRKGAMIMALAAAAVAGIGGLGGASAQAAHAGALPPVVPQAAGSVWM